MLNSVFSRKKKSFVQTNESGCSCDCFSIPHQQDCTCENNAFGFAYRCALPKARIKQCQNSRIQESYSVLYFSASTLEFGIDVKSELTCNWEPIKKGIWNVFPRFQVKVNRRKEKKCYDKIKILHVYRIVASTSPSRIEAHAGIFRSLMKGIFDPYVL